MTKFKNTVKNIVLFCIPLIEEIYNLGLACVMLLGLFYIRLIPRVSRDLWQNMTQYQILFTLFQLILIGINIYFLLVILIKIKVKKKSNLIAKITERFRVIIDYFLWILCNFYEFLWKLLDIMAENLFKTESLHYHVLRKLAIILFKDNKFNLYFTILLTLNLLPKILFGTAFFIDVIIYKKLYYTFLTIPFLLISLLEVFLIFIFKHYYDCYYDSISSFMEKTTINTTDGPIIRYRFYPGTEKSVRKYFTNMNDYYNNHYLVLIQIERFISEYKIFKEEIFPYTKILFFLSLLRFLLLLFILFYGVL